jgi:uncharacterized protein
LELLLGFVIAVAISLTGVGAGSMTTPLLILLLGVSPTTAVGTALAFGTIVKVISVPAYLVRGQINFRILAVLLAGGVPGVLGGSLLVNSLKGGPYDSWLYAILGILIVLTASFHLYRTLKPIENASRRDHPSLLAGLALPIGAEVGFSSAGAGALGSLLLFGLTRLTTTEVVGTDLCFGLVVSALGSAVHLGAGNFNGGLLVKLAVGGIFGAVTGSLLAGKIAPVPMRLVVLIMLVILGTQLALHGQAIAAPHLQAVLR